MLLRFCLYGFLKNQRYFEPFLVLIFLEKGMSFFAIGCLVAFREVCINLFEVPTGAIADVFGRRRAMIFSFAAYIASFVVFGLSVSVPLLFVAMLLFAIGEAFRTGTHKAMIFTWLRMNGRIHERTRVYGFTRSWSQIGSAVSVVLAAGFVLASNSYAYVFLFAIIPYAANLANFLGYPAALDGDRDPDATLGSAARHLRDALATALRKPDLRRLMLESMGFEGIFAAVKDYLQPVLKAAALALLASVSTGDALGAPQQAALLVGPVYLLLHLASAWGSRRAHELVAAAGGEDRAAGRLWLAAAALYLVIAVAGFATLAWLLIPAFALLHVLQAVWRPVIISRFDSHSDERQGATVLSIESQAQSIATMATAPVLGLAIDMVAAHGLGGAFWPAGAIGLLVALLMQGPGAPWRRSPRAAA